MGRRARGRHAICEPESGPSPTSGSFFTLAAANGGSAPRGTVAPDQGAGVRMGDGRGALPRVKDSTTGSTELSRGLISTVKAS